MSEYTSDEDLAYEEMKRRERDEASPRQPQYEDAPPSEREYEDS